MQERTEQVRARILASARHLFKTVGYEKTTIRLIVEDSGVLTGSIYHLFKNKEEIFLTMVDEKLELCLELVERNFAQESALFRFLCLYDMHLRIIMQSKIMRDNYYAIYSSALIVEHIIDEMAVLTKRLFQEVFPQLTLEDYRVRNALIQGAIRNCIMGMYFKRPLPFVKTGVLLLRIILFAFNINPDRSTAMIGKIKQHKKKLEKITRELVEMDS